MMEFNVRVSTSTPEGVVVSEGTVQIDHSEVTGVAVKLGGFVEVERLFARVQGGLGGLLQGKREKEDVIDLPDRLERDVRSRGGSRGRGVGRAGRGRGWKVRREGPGHASRR